MKGVVGVSALVLCAGLVAGCGGSGVTGIADPVAPVWLTKIMRHEAALLGDRSPRPIAVTFGKQKDVDEMFGEFRTPAPAPCTTSYCPVPVRLRGTSVRLVVSPRTHRLLSVTIGRQIAHTQAPEIARRASPFLRIFRSLPGTITCSIPPGGQGSVHLRGRCTTEFVSSPPYRRGEIRIGFIERWREARHLSRGGWIVTVGLENGRVLGVQITGKIPPQLWM